jgi:hypothetical protein
MTPLDRRLAAVLAEVLAVEQEDDGALTVRHDGTLASLRAVPIAEGLDLVSLNQLLAWGLSPNRRLREQVAEQAAASQLGSVILAEQAASKTADIMLRYNFPGNGLSDDALRTLVLLVLDQGAEIGRALTG